MKIGYSTNLTIFLSLSKGGHTFSTPTLSCYYQHYWHCLYYVMNNNEMKTKFSCSITSPEYLHYKVTNLSRSPASDHPSPALANIWPQLSD